MYGRDSFYNEFGSGSASLYEIGQPGKPNCSDIPPLACHNLPIERPIKAAGLPEGGLIDRTAGDPDKELSLQLSDYDVNEWRAGQKDRHRLGLERIMKFIIDRRTEILKGEGIEITISGAASRTGTKEYNDRLSCKRAACVAGFIQQHLPVSIGGSDALLRKVRFTIGGEGFQKATCAGAQCEIGEFRSVLVSVHRPGRAPAPIPILPRVVTKYRIRCCSLKSETLGEALIGDLIDRGLAALPDPLRKAIEGNDKARGLIDKAVKELIDQLKKLLTRLPGALGKLAKSLSQKLPFPVEFIRDTGVFQIVERDEKNPKDIILCYTGFGLRLLFPRNLPFALPAPLRDALKQALKGLKIQGLPLDIALDVLGGKIPSIESKTPGPFTDFDVKPGSKAPKPFRLQAFEGDAVLFKSADLPGKVRVGFDSPRTFHRPDPAERPRLLCSGCTDSIVPVTVGTGRGVDIIAPTKGTLVDAQCRCDEAPGQQARLGVRQPIRSAIRPRVAVRRALRSGRRASV